jgi:aldose sugar dehydrogenase
MNRSLLLLMLTGMASYAFGQGETFSAKKVINQSASLPADRFRLQHPYELIYGPDDSLWITERSGRVLKVDPISGRMQVMLDHRSAVRFTRTVNGLGQTTGVAQDGMLGMALHPDLNRGLGKDSVYVAYCYNASGNRRIRVSAFFYNRSTRALSGERTLLDNIPGSNDHNSGRVVIGPDLKLYYTVGDLGNNQFGNYCNAIRAQDVPTNAEVTANDRTKYSGKILRMNLDGSIPSDNPLFAGVRSHIFSIGHRNPQGLVFEKNSAGNAFIGSHLYSNEHGPAADDELNVIQGGKNYGWPNVSGYKDNYWYRYYNWSSAANCSSQTYTNECSVPSGVAPVSEFAFTDPNFVPPILTMSTKDSSSGYTLPCNWLQNPTIAPASMEYYYFNNMIPGWSNSLLIPTLKKGTVYRVKLNAARNVVQGDTIPYFVAENRYRDIAIARDGLTFYLITDSVGQTSGPTTGNPTILNDRGGILEYKYTGATLSVDNNPPINPRNSREYIRMYPNPVNGVLTVELKRNISKPILYQVFDVEGRIMLSGNSMRDMTAIDMTALRPGVYIVKLFNGADVNIATEKIIRQ